MAARRGLEPPGPPGYPLVGNLPELARDVLGFFDRCAREYGPIARIRLGLRTAWLLTDPDDVKTVLVTRHRDFVKHSWFWRHVRRVFGTGLLTSEGDAWVRRRRLAQPAFHADRIAGYGDTMVAYTERMLDGWEEGEEIDLRPELMGLTMRIVSKVLFDARVDAHVDRIGRAFDEALVEVAVRFRRGILIPDWVPTPGNRRYLRAVRAMEEVVYGFIGQARAREHDGEDLLSMLVRARDEDGRGLTDEAVRDEAITLFLAGHETTALALTWAWHLLGEHPEAARRLHEEVDRVLGTRLPTARDVEVLQWTEAVVLEAMRLFPPAYAIGREAVRDLELGDYRMAAGTTVFISPMLMHRDPRFWDDPEGFRPERWMDGLADRVSPFVYLPFGGGPRRCIGHRFAMMEAVLLLSTMARRVRLEPLPGPPPQPFPTITLRPEGGVRVRVRRREPGGARLEPVH